MNLHLDTGITLLAVMGALAGVGVLVFAAAQRWKWLPDNLVGAEFVVVLAMLIALGWGLYQLLLGV